MCVCVLIIVILPFEDNLTTLVENLKRMVGRVMDSIKVTYHSIELGLKIQGGRTYHSAVVTLDILHLLIQ